MLCLEVHVEFTDPDLLALAVGWFEWHPKVKAVGSWHRISDGTTHYMQPAIGDLPCFASRLYSYGRVVRRALLAEMGAFNKEFGYFHEEPEFSLRLLAQSYRVVYDSEVSLIHHQDDRHRNWSHIHCPNA